MITIFDLLRSVLMEWWVIVLVASFFFALGTHLDERLLIKHNQAVGTLVIVSSFFGLVLSLLFFLISSHLSVSLVMSTSNTMQSLLVGVMEIVWIVPYLYATRRRGALVAGPLFQCIPVVVVFLELFSGILPTPLQVAGIVFLVVGGIVLSIEKNEDESGKPVSNIDWTTVGLMGIAILLISLIYLMFKDAATADDASYLAVGFWSGIGMTMAGVAFWLFYPPYRQDFNQFAAKVRRRPLSIQIFNEMLDASGAYLTHLANIIGPSIAIVTALNASQPLFILLIGLYLTFRNKGEYENIDWKQVAFAIIMISIGAIIVAFSTN
jgi:drug/metabolite transporter (DMT)-like permease